MTGPTNGLSLVLFSLTVHLRDRYPEVSVFEAILLLSLMSGIIQLSFGLLRLGGMVRYVANSVVVGFTDLFASRRGRILSWHRSVDPTYGGLTGPCEVEIVRL